MPMREIHLRRWHLLLLLGVFTLWSVAYAYWSDERIDAAERRISANTVIAVSAAAQAEVAAAENRLQDQIRRERVAEFRRNNMRFCREIESIKERIRATVRVRPREQYEETLRRLTPDISEEQVDALYAQAKAQEQEVQERFAPSDCATVPGG